jgi:hypothetical protein
MFAPRGIIASLAMRATQVVTPAKPKTIARKKTLVLAAIPATPAICVERETPAPHLTPATRTIIVGRLTPNVEAKIPQTVSVGILGRCNEVISPQFRNRSIQFVKIFERINARAALGVLVCALSTMTLALNAQTTARDSIPLYLQSVKKIESFDATVSIVNWNIKVSDYEQGTNSSHPKKLGSEVDRDVFAVGLGRHLERNRDGKPLATSVIDWKTATARKEPLSDVLSGAGSAYLECIDPLLGQEGCFLTDALTSNNVVVSELGGSPGSKILGLQLEFPKKQTFQNVFRIWFDSDHGYMVAKFERLTRSVPDEDHSLGLINLMQVEEFRQVDDGIWVPAKVRSYSVAGSDELALDKDKSSFNSIKTGAPFSVASLPKVNHQEDGWSQYLPPATLIRATTFERATRPASNRPKIVTKVILGLLGVGGLALIFFTFRDHFNGRKKTMYQG